MTTILLVRHGRTDWTDELRLQGQTDIPLNATGRSTSHLLRPLVQQHQPQSLVVSPAVRAVMTAEEISELSPVHDPRLQEAHLGSWEGMTPQQIGPDYALWRAGKLVPPGGEAMTKVHARVKASLLSAAELPGPVLLVTHGGVIRAMLDGLVGLRPENLVPVEPASLCVLEVEADAPARLRHYNLTAPRLLTPSTAA